MRNTLVIIILLFLSCSCGKSNADYDLTSIDEDVEAGTAEKYVGCIRTIPLETRNGCVVDQGASLVDVGPEGILLRSGNNLLLFSGEGNFLHGIGREGHGHGEHGRILSVCADTEGKRIYVLSFGGELTVYRYDGSFLWKRILRAPRDYHVISLFYGLDTGLLCEMRCYKNPGLDERVARMDSTGALTSNTLIYSDDDEVEVTRSSYSISYRYGEIAKLKLDFEAHLYSFGGEGVGLEAFDLGDFAPNRAELEDMRQQRTLLSDRCQILDIEENGSYLFLIVSLKNQYRLVVVDKREGKIVANLACENPKWGGGLPVRGFASLQFWPSWTNGRTMASLVSPSELDAADLSKIYGEGARSLHAADLNPVVLLTER